MSIQIPTVLRSQIARALNESSDSPSVEVTRIRRTRKMSLSMVPIDSSSSSPSACPIHILRIRTGGPCTCSSLAELLDGTGLSSSTPSGPQRDYLSRVNVRSRPVAADSPLCVISLDGVVDARLPTHLAGGYTDVISRPYLQTFIKYVLHKNTPWCFVFFTSLSRTEGLKTLKDLGLPTGGPEEDERDGVLGLFARDDMRDWSGSKLKIKDLEEMWASLEEEEGVKWGVENTVVLSANPAELARQPFNMIHVPPLIYKSTTRPVDDLFLLHMVAVLKDLETETNFAYHIKEMEWNTAKPWTSATEDEKSKRNEMLFNAVRVCAANRITIKAFTGNYFPAGITKD